MKHVNNTLARDKHVIEAVVRKFGPVSRSGIHELTQIRRSTTSNLVRELLAEGKLIVAGHLNNQMGRKQVLLRINPQYRFLAAVEFDDERVIAGVFDLEARPQCTVTEPTNIDSGREGLIRQLLGCVRKALEKAGLSEQALLGVGIADTGLVDSRRGVTVTSAKFNFWREVPVKAIFEQSFGVPALLESRTRAKAVAERALGAGESADDMIYVDYGSGIGAAMIVDGRLLYGHDCGAGELGHTHVVEDGPICRCGSRGCLEAIAGTRAAEVRLRQALREGGRSQAAALAGGDPDQITGWTVLKAARQGDKICLNIVAEIASQLGLALANLVNLFNPAVVVLDEDLELAGPRLLEQLTYTVERQALTASTGRLAFHFATLGANAAILGVALMLLDSYFEIPMLKPPSFMVRGSATEEDTAPELQTAT